MAAVTPLGDGLAAAAAWKVESHTAGEEGESILRCGVCVYVVVCSSLSEVRNPKRKRTVINTLSIQ